MSAYQRRAVWIVCLLTAIIPALTGCGGSGGNIALTGKPAMRALTISGYQTQVAATKYVLPMLVAGAPSGSPLAGFQGASLLGRTSPAAAPRAMVIQYDSALNLYYQGSASGATYTVNFYKDAAGTASAGYMKATIEGASVFDTDYTTYPVTVDISADVTAGNLVASGTGKIVFTDGAGANTLTGNITAPEKGIQASLDMTLDATGKVGGSLTVVQNGLTAVVTGLAGDLPHGFTGSAAVSPGNLTGTATINLLLGTYSLVINDPSGLHANATVDAAHNLDISYSDGTSLKLSDTLNQPVKGVGSNSGGGSTSSYTIAAVNGAPWKIVSVTPDGQMVGAVGIYNTLDFRYWASPTAAPQAITLDSGLTIISVTGINSSGHLVGSGLNPATNLPVLLYWSAYNQAPVRLTLPTAPPAGFQFGATATVLVQSSDRIVATFSTQSFGGFVSYVYSGPTDTSPYMVQGGHISGLSDGNAALGYDSSGLDVLWPVLSASATPLPVPEPVSTSLKAAYIGADGTIIVFDLGTTTVWYVSAPAYTSRVALAPPAGRTNIGAGAVGPAGQVLGWVVTSSTSLDNEGLIWNTPTSAPVVLRTTETPNVLGAVFATTAGALIVNCSDSPGVARYHYSVLTPK
jgi:hypothetical protein